MTNEDLSFGTHGNKNDYHMISVSVLKYYGAILQRLMLRTDKYLLDRELVRYIERRRGGSYCTYVTCIRT